MATEPTPGPHRAVTPDLGELRALCVAAELGTLGRAAIRLHVSQPSLSKRLASLEAKVGARLLERSSRGVVLTTAGRRLYTHARSLLEQADEVGEIMLGLKRSREAVRLAASHSATDAFVARMLQDADRSRRDAVELVTANSQVVRSLVADGRADVGVAASRPGRTPNPGVRETELADDSLVCGVPSGHRWARRKRISVEEFVRTPMVLRDPSSNARWTMDAVLGRLELTAAHPEVEAPTPSAALAEARLRDAPVVLSRHVLAQAGDFTVVAVEGLDFPRAFVLVAPAYGEPTAEVRDVIERITRAAGLWLR